VQIEFFSSFSYLGQLYRSFFIITLWLVFMNEKSVVKYNILYISTFIFLVYIYIHTRRDYSQHMLSENRSWADLLREKKSQKKENHITSGFYGSVSLISAVTTKSIQLQRSQYLICNIFNVSSKYQIFDIVNDCNMAVAMTVKMFGITMQKCWNYKHCNKVVAISQIWNYTHYKK
jgi:hypothetical protein